MSADSTFPTPYCTITYSNALSGNGQRYEVKVDFRQSDARALNTSVAGPGSTWVAGNRNPASGIDGVTANVANKSITFTNKTMFDLSGINFGNSGTFNGTTTFPANASVAACG